MSETVIESPAAAPSDVLSSLSKGQLADWRLTGTLPEDTPSSSGSASDMPEQAASTDASPSTASEPVTSAAKPVSTKPKANAETRKAELNAEIQALLKQRDELRTSVAAPQPTPPPRQDVTVGSSSTGPVALPDLIARPDVQAPAMTEGEFFVAYPDAEYRDYVRYTSRYEYFAVRAEEQRTQAEHARAQTIQAQVKAYGDRVRAAQADQDFRIDESLLNLTPVDFKPASVPLSAEHVIAQEIMTSELAPAILRHLTDHPDEFAALKALDSPQAVSRAMGRLEARLDTSSVTPTKPVVKTTTSAPAPPETLGRKPSAPVDDAEAALAAGDVGRYIRAKNAQEAASLKR